MFAFAHRLRNRLQRTASSAERSSERRTPEMSREDIGTSQLLGLTAQPSASKRTSSTALPRCGPFGQWIDRAGHPIGQSG